MEHPDDITAAAGTAKQALRLMMDRKIPATPQNYLVWYTYVSGREPDLIRAIDKMIADGLSLDGIENAELFENFLDSPRNTFKSKKRTSKSRLP